jgi:peptidoglycan/LPS O-acetylase OafA/YrhL
MPEVSGGRRLPYIDGLRGIAALVVAVGHIAGMARPDAPTTSLAGADTVHLLLWPFLFGGQAVWLFLMVSGFALYYSEMSRRVGGTSPTPWRHYAARRAWRILPTYYVGLALGAIVVLGAGRLYLPPAASLDTVRPVTTAGVLAHLGLIQNFSAGWLHQVSAPLWSVAVEAQWYLLFPLLTLRRLRSPWLAAAACLIVARGLQHVTGEQILGLAEFFLAGVCLAHVCLTRVIPRRTAGAIAAVACLVGLLRLASVPALGNEVLWLIGFVALLAFLYTSEAPGPRFLHCTPVQWLGKRSYSLYVVHFPCALALWFAVGRLPLDHTELVTLMVIGGLPLCLLLTMVCYRAVERPSLRRVQATGSTAARGDRALKDLGEPVESMLMTLPTPHVQPTAALGMHRD